MLEYSLPITLAYLKVLAWLFFIIAGCCLYEWLRKFWRGER